MFKEWSCSGKKKILFFCIHFCLFYNIILPSPNLQQQFIVGMQCQLGGNELHCYLVSSSIQHNSK
jgi:hypothetical protein